MSSYFCRSAVCGVLILSLSTVLSAKPKKAAGEKIENPAYAAWSKFKPGTLAIWKVVETNGGDETQSTIERKLVEIRDDKVILKKTTKQADNESKTETVSIARMVSADQARIWNDPVGKKESREVTIAALSPKQKFKAHVLVYAKKGKSGETTTTDWLSDEVPGLIIKREVVSDGHQSTTTLTQLIQPDEEGEKVAGAENKSGSSKPSKTVWLTNYEKALAAARAEKKLVMLDFTGSDWCGWCMRLDKEVFETPEFKKWAGNKLVLVKLDFPRRKQLPEKLKQQNDKLLQKHKVQGFPTLIIVDKSGKAIGQLGYVAGGPNNWIAEAEKVLSSAEEASSVRLPKSLPAAPNPGK